jgi:hypothetical protein
MFRSSSSDQAALTRPSQLWWWRCVCVCVCVLLGWWAGWWVLARRVLVGVWSGVRERMREPCQRAQRRLAHTQLAGQAQRRTRLEAATPHTAHSTQHTAHIAPTHTRPPWRAHLLPGGGAHVLPLQAAMMARYSVCGMSDLEAANSTYALPSVTSSVTPLPMA